MGRISLQHGVYTAALGLGGAGFVIVAPSQEWFGWLMIAAAVGLSLWGIRINGRHWWQRAIPSPIDVADTLFIDCDPVGHSLGGIAMNLYSVAFCLEVRNNRSDGKTLRSVGADLYLHPGERNPLIVRRTNSTEADVHHGHVELIEVGRVLIRMENGHAPAVVRSNGARQIVSTEDINSAFNPHPSIRQFRVSTQPPTLLFGEGKGSANGMIFDVVVSAADTPAKRLRLTTNLWADNPKEWLRITSA